jgi:general secretion pathway protein D
MAERSFLGMKPGKWIPLAWLALFLFMGGTIHCAGPQSALNPDPPVKQASKGKGEMSREVPPEEALPGAIKKSSGELARENPGPLPGRAVPAQVLPVSMKEERFAQKPEPPAQPPQPLPRQMMPRSFPVVPAPSPGVSAQQPAPPAPPTGTSPAPGPARRPEPSKGARFVLNFDNADIYEVIRVMAEMMGINYVMDPRVRGVVNIRTSGQISTQDIFPIFQTILKMNGATAVQKGIIYEIVPFVEAKKLYTRPTAAKTAGRTQEEEKYTIQIVMLKYIPAGEVAKMIRPFLSDGADIVEHPAQNLLVVGDLSSNIQKSLEIIDLFDVDIFSDMRVRIYPILNADVTEVAKEMERIFSSLEVSLKSGRGVGITFTPVTRINSLLAVSSIPGIFDKVERWVKELDRIPGEGTQVSVFVYYVQNGKAKDLAEVLKQVYVPVKGAKPDARERAVTPAPAPAAATTPGPRGVRPAPTTPAAPGAAREESGAVPEGEINIVVDETTNSLIIRSFHRDYKAILETNKKLDIYPKQVLIEVLLADVTLDDTTKYGLEWSTFSDSFTRGGRTYSYTLGAGGIAPQTDLVSGLRYAITSVDRLAAAISASATEDRLRVVSAPHILASNNKEARIQVGRSEPILTNTYTTTGTTSPGVVEGTIEYKDIGIILTVTPRISDGKLVTLDLSVEQSTVGKTTLGNLADVPFFPKKTAKTTLSIMEKQTIVIGGLIEDRKENIKTGIPYLSKIPVLGALFGYHTNVLNKVETVLFLTPHVVGDIGDSNRVTEEFRDKVHSIQKELERLKQQKQKEKEKEKDRSKKEPEEPRSGVIQSRALDSISP